MKRIVRSGYLSIVLAVVLTVVTLQPSGYVGAQDGETATSPPGEEGTPAETPATGSELQIPTGTPEGDGGLLVPTVTPTSGLLIPTSTAAPSEPSFPPLSDEQLGAILVQPADVPADFAASQNVETYVVSNTVAALAESGSAELAASLEQIISTYGWERSKVVNYSLCRPDLPIDQIYSSVGQFSTSALGRAFFDDPQVQAVFAEQDYELIPIQTPHGWRATTALEEAPCFAKETVYWVFFEYWGLLGIVAMRADANTDPQLVWNLIDQLVGVVLAHADAVASQPFPPTPTPGAVAPTPTATVVKPTTVLVLPPTPTAPVATPTQPKPLTPTAVVKFASLQDIDAAMPTIDDLELLSPPWALDDTTSGTSTASQVVAQLQSGSRYELAASVQRVGQQAGLVGQVTRLWSTGLDCTIPVQDVQIVVALFNDSQGPVTYMNDVIMQQAWINTGLFTNIMPYQMGNTTGQLWIGGTTFDPCAPVAYRTLVMPYGRFLITVLTIAAVTSNLDNLNNANEYLVELTITKLEEAGLQ